MRLARTILLFLVLGVIVNVGVAWGCTCRMFNIASSLDLIRQLGEVDGDAVWVIERETVGASTVFLIRQELETSEAASKFDRSLQEHIPRWIVDHLPSMNKIGVLTASGWPCAALLCYPEWRSSSSTVRRYTTHPSRYGFVVMRREILTPNSARVQLTLPYLPLWPGFIINTLFYGAILFVLIRGPSILRRHLRKRRNQCLTCGYRLQGSDAGCPECGEGREAIRPIQ